MNNCVACRVWLTADGRGWHGWHERELRPTHDACGQPIATAPVRIAFPSRAEAQRAASATVEKLLAYDAAVQRGMRAKRRGARTG